MIQTEIQVSGLPSMVRDVVSSFIFSPKNLFYRKQVPKFGCLPIYHTGFFNFITPKKPEKQGLPEPGDRLNCTANGIAFTAVVEVKPPTEFTWCSTFCSTGFLPAFIPSDSCRLTERQDSYIRRLPEFLLRYLGLLANGNLEKYKKHSIGILKNTLRAEKASADKLTKNIGILIICPTSQLAHISSNQLALD